MRCCRRPNARAAAMRDASPMPRRSRAARRRSINARRAAAPLIESLARLLDRPALPLNPANGVEAPPRVAWIDESRCIGCARCLAPCPVDAIVGAAKFMHTVLADRCTGCELCLPPCPVDCIELRPRPQPDSEPSPRSIAPLRRAHGRAAESSRRSGNASSTPRRRPRAPRGAAVNRAKRQAIFERLRAGQSGAAHRADLPDRRSSSWSP